MGEADNINALGKNEFQNEITLLHEVNSKIQSLIHENVSGDGLETQIQNFLQAAYSPIQKKNTGGMTEAPVEIKNGAGNLYEMLETNSRYPYRDHRILLLVDNPDMLEFLSYPLQANYLIFICTSIKEAYEKMAVIVPDMIISDTSVSETDGIEFCKMIKEDYEYRKIPFVLISGKKNKIQERIRGFDAGADEFLSRPFNPRELIARINSLLRMRNLYQTIGSFESVIYSLANAVEAKDEYTNGHCQRLMDVALLISEKMGLSNYQISVIRHGAILHDIGKIGIPEHILNKPDSLTDEEFNVIKAHPMIGVKICKPLSNIENFLPIIRNHHERIDGKGYPDGLMGHEIPIEVKIVSVADAFDAIYSDRPYRKGKTLDETLLYFRNSMDMGQWDAEIVKILININLNSLEQKWQKLINTL